MEGRVDVLGKIRLKRKDSLRICATFFFGSDEEHLQNAGELVLTEREWEYLVAAIGGGLGFAKIMHVQTDELGKQLPFNVIVEGEMEALGREEELNGEPDVRRMPVVQL